MCGITGIISKKPISKNILEPMTDTIIHRGPDGFGYAYGDYFAFGHRRLSIVDLSEAGHQPMEYNNRYIITFNGEIYNHFELRIELEDNGYSFHSHTDTEVIMAAYDYWGTECLNRFNGMWAFVIYDKLKDKFFISRDRFGKKPFYYYRNEDTFIFASEIKALLVHPEVEARPNIAFLDDYVQSNCREYTKDVSFEDIYRFDFSSYFEGSLAELLGDFKAQKFWEIKPNLSHEKFDKEKANDLAKQYYDLLEDAVKIRLRADVKVGSALSGGLDSSSIVYLVNKLLKEQGKQELQETFSSVYKSDGTQDCDESVYIDIMATKLGVHSNQIEPDEKNIPNEIEKMIWHLENPPENSLMSSWYTFKLVASTDVKVTLDGQGADEQLAGYLGYIHVYLTSISLYDFYKELMYFIQIPRSFKHIVVAFIMNHFKLFFGKYLLKIVVKLVTGRKLELDLNKKLADDTMSDLITLIHYADHTSMAYSIESRMPFMDYRLVEFLASVPACYKMHNGWTKYLARLAFDGKLPNEVNWRKDKMGWPIPERKWFEGSLKNWFLDKKNSCQICKKLNFSNAKNQFVQNVKRANLSIWQTSFLKGTH